MRTIVPSYPSAAIKIRKNEWCFVSQKTQFGTFMESRTHALERSRSLALPSWMNPRSAIVGGAIFVVSSHGEPGSAHWKTHWHLDLSYQGKMPEISFEFQFLDLVCTRKSARIPRTLAMHWEVRKHLGSHKIQADCMTTNCYDARRLPDQSS